MTNTSVELWDLISPEYNFIAKDSDENIWAYVDEPFFNNPWGWWNCSLTYTTTMKLVKNPKVTAFFTNIPPKFSLMKRPK